VSIERQGSAQRRQIETDFPAFPELSIQSNNPAEIASALSQFKLGIDSWYYKLRQKLQTIQGPQTTDDLPEGDSQYFTEARARASLSSSGPITYGSTTGVIGWAGSTTSVTEGTNLYWTDARFNTAFAGKRTDDLSEGVANFYYTSARWGSDYDTARANAAEWTAVQTFSSGVNLGLAAYATSDQSTPYTTLGAGADIASMAELNTLRAAYENLRLAFDDLYAKSNA
jgi:hypothetical protein